MQTSVSQITAAQPKPIVLIVDDVPECVEMLGAILEPDYTVLGATCGQEALELARCDPPPDVVLLDVEMPGMDGHSVLAALRRDPRTRDIPAIFVTSLQDAGDQLQSLAAGAADFIAKPASPSLLHARVRSQLELRHTRDTLRRSNLELQLEVDRRHALEQQLQESLSELQAFSYSVSHDLRAPLSAINIFAQSVRETEGDAISPVARHRLDRIVAGSSRMNSMIDDMLAYARADHRVLQAGAVDLNALVLEAIEPLQALHPRVWVTVEALPKVNADESAMRQVLDNLLGNAFKFSAGRPDPRILVDTSIEAGHPVIRVRDNGAGFDPRAAGRLFTLFQRLHSQEEFAGSGVGLAIVKRLVQRHGGSVAAESVPGGWTTFSFTLPATPH